MVLRSSGATFEELGRIKDLDLARIDCTWTPSLKGAVSLREMSSCSMKGALGQQEFTVNGQLWRSGWSRGTRRMTLGSSSRISHGSIRVIHQLSCCIQCSRSPLPFLVRPPVRYFYCPRSEVQSLDGIDPRHVFCHCP